MSGYIFVAKTMDGLVISDSFAAFEDVSAMVEAYSPERESGGRTFPELPSEVIPFIEARGYEYEKGFYAYGVNRFAVIFRVVSP